MKIIITAVLAAVVGFAAGYFSNYKPVPIGTAQVDSTSLMNLTNQLAMQKMSADNCAVQASAFSNDVVKAAALINKLAPDAKRGRTLPVKGATRTAITDNTIVFQFKISPPEQLPVQVTFSNATFGAKTFDRVLSSGEVIEIGTKEGWKGLHGDTVIINSEGYNPTKFEL